MGKRLVEEPLEHRRARAGNRRVAGRIGWMHRGAFRIGLRQQVRLVPLGDETHRRGLHDALVQRVARSSREVHVHSRTEFLGPEPSVHEPLVVPRVAEGEVGDTGDEVDRLRPRVGSEVRCLSP